MFRIGIWITFPGAFSFGTGPIGICGKLAVAVSSIVSSKISIEKISSGEGEVCGVTVIRKPLITTA